MGLRNRAKERATPANARRAIGVAKAVIPVLMPLALQAASATRDRWDRMRAQRLGVPVQRLAEFTGKGAALQVRVTALATSLDELRARHPEESGFVEAGERRVADLAGAVRAAERMPAGRRRAIHQTVESELDALERELLGRLGV